MRGNILVAIPDERDRGQLMRELNAHRLVPYEAPDFAQGMAMLGRADFSAIVVGESKYALSLRGFCLLARKRHPMARIFITLSPTRAAGSPAPQIGVGEVCLAPGLPAVMVARQISDGPAPTAANPFDIPTTTTVWSTLEDAAAEQRGAVVRAPQPTAPTRILTAPPPPVTRPLHVDLPPMARMPADPMPMPTTMIVDGPPQVEESNILMMGDFDEMGGPALLMTLLAQQLTGRLVIQSGPADGTLFVYRGDPVWAEDPMGDGGLFIRLVQRGVLQPGTRRPDVPDGQMVATLGRAGSLRAEDAQQCMLAMVKERVSMLASQRSGTWLLIEDRDFLSTAPLFKVNSFGLILDAHKRNLTSSQLGNARSKLSQRIVAAAPALSAAVDLIRPFVRGKDLARLLKTPMLVEEMWNLLQLDALAGALLTLTMMDARLITLTAQAPAPTPEPLNVTAPRASQDDFDVPDTQVIDDAQMAAVPPTQTLAEEEILQMYLRLKPLKSARLVLGLDAAANEEVVRVAYYALLATLDPARVPPGPRHELLLSYVHELRRKADLALKTVLAQPR